MCEAREHPVFTLHDGGAHRRGRQAGDHDVDAGGELTGRGRRPGTARDERRDAPFVDVTDGEVHPVAQEVAGELTADVAEADEADTQVCHSGAFGCGYADLLSQYASILRRVASSGSRPWPAAWLSIR